MRLSNKNQNGSGVVEIALIVVIVAAIAVVAVKVVNRNSGTTTSNPVATSTQASLPSKIQSKADLNQSVKALDSTPIDNTLNPDQLNSNINSLL